MARTLQQLKESIERMISQQGSDAPVAAFIFTKEDVFSLDDDGNQIYDIPDEIVGRVLNEMEDNDHLYTESFDIMGQFLEVFRGTETLPANVWMIVNTEDRNLFWSNEDGWVEYYSADSFNDDEKDTLNLPLEGEWQIMS